MRTPNVRYVMNAYNNINLILLFMLHIDETSH